MRFTMWPLSEGWRRKMVNSLWFKRKTLRMTNWKFCIRLTETKHLLFRGCYCFSCFSVIFLNEIILFSTFWAESVLYKKGRTKFILSNDLFLLLKMGEMNFITKIRKLSPEFYNKITNYRQQTFKIITFKSNFSEVWWWNQSIHWAALNSQLFINKTIIVWLLRICQIERTHHRKLVWPHTKQWNCKTEKTCGNRFTMRFQFTKFRQISS